MIDIDRYIHGFAGSALSEWRTLAPWELMAHSADVVRQLLAGLSHTDYLMADEIAAHPSSIVERGAVLKGPLILGPGCFIASGAYLRGGCWLERDCIVGPGAELKSSFMFAGSRLTHFNFVGDSLLGADVNLEAGSIICNHRNERVDNEVRVRVSGRLHRTGRETFGALVGDGARIGANAVVAPGAILPRDWSVQRAALCDQEIA
jgi:NDP-sugar pyrophosphorylase family protein